MFVKRTKDCLGPRALRDRVHSLSPREGAPETPRVEITAQSRADGLTQNLPFSLNPRETKRTFSIFRRDSFSAQIRAATTATHGELGGLCDNLRSLAAGDLSCIPRCGALTVFPALAKGAGEAFVTTPGDADLRLIAEEEAVMADAPVPPGHVIVETAPILATIQHTGNKLSIPKAALLKKTPRIVCETTQLLIG